MKKLIGFFILLLFVGVMNSAVAATPPVLSLQYLPILNDEMDTYWKLIPDRRFPPALVDQESNWKINARLRTEREDGCGFGQFTKAYNKDGSIRFDALTEAKQLDPSLAGWTWKDCSNAKYQLRAVVLKTKSNYRDCSVLMGDPEEALNCVSARYNGGAGSVNTRIRKCRATPGCNPKVWKDNLERQCPQSNTKVKGYGESFCQINSKYPGRLRDRMPKFTGYMRDL